MNLNEIPLLDRIPVNLFVLDRTTYRLLYVNQSTAETYSLNANIPEDYNYLEIHPESERSSVRQFLSGTTYQPVPDRIWHHIMSGGSLSAVGLTQRNAFYKGEEIILLVVTPISHLREREKLKEDTNRNQNEHALLESEEKFNQLADNVKELFWLRDLNTGQVLYKNPAYLNFFEGDSKSKNLSLSGMIERTHPEDLKSLLEILSCRDYARTDETSIRFYTNSGSLKWFMLKVQPVHNLKNIPERQVGIAYDVTTLKQAEVTLKTALNLEKKLNEMKSGFVSMASHEFRTPMTSIMISADLIRLYNKRMSDTEIIKHTSIIIRKVDNLRNLISKILNLSSIEKGKISFSFCHTDLTAVLKSWSEENMHLYMANHSIKCKFPTHSISAWLDPHLFVHAMDNLVSNSIKYSPPGTAICIKMIQKNERIIISIADHGFGISPDEHEFLFDPFYRSQGFTSISGTGLGLPFVKKITESHSGNIRLKSKVNKGTVFFIDLPQIKEYVPQMSISD
jgi:PAS domain S-box-containing protein